MKSFSPVEVSQRYADVARAAQLEAVQVAPTDDEPAVWIVSDSDYASFQELRDQAAETAKLALKLMQKSVDRAGLSEADREALYLELYD